MTFFYYYHYLYSFKDFDPQKAITAFIFLAFKANNTYMSITQFQTIFKEITKKEVTSEEITRLEIDLLEKICYNLEITTPFMSLINKLKSYSRSKALQTLYKHASALIWDCYRKPLVCYYTPDHIADCSIYLAIKSMNESDQQVILSEVKLEEENMIELAEEILAIVSK